MLRPMLHSAQEERNEMNQIEMGKQMRLDSRNRLTRPSVTLTLAAYTDKDDSLVIGEYGEPM